MKLKFLLVILLSGILFAYGQDSTRIHMQRDKFTKGDIGLRYQLAYDGSLQSQFTVSGFVAKRVEIGGTFAFSVNHVSNTYKGTTYLPNDSLGKYQTTNKSWGYKLGFSPYVIGHFPMKGRFDIYLGALAIFEISKTGTDNGTIYTQTSTTTDPSFLYTDNKTRNPVEYRIGVGAIIGCQYFLNRHIALGIQASEWLGQVFAKDKAYSTQSSGGTIPGPSTNTLTPLNYDHSTGVGGYGGITLSYYFSKKKKGVGVRG